MIVAAIIILVGPAGFLAGAWFIRALEDRRLSSWLARTVASTTQRPAPGPKRMGLANFPMIAKPFHSPT